MSRKYRKRQKEREKTQNQNKMLIIFEHSIKHIKFIISLNYFDYL